MCFLKPSRNLKTSKTKDAIYLESKIGCVDLIFKSCEDKLYFAFLRPRPFGYLSSSQVEDEGQEKEDGVERDRDEDGGRVVLGHDVLVDKVKVLDSLSSAGKAARNLK